MTSNIKQLIAAGENQHVEFKSSLRVKPDIGKAISAFANTSGGTILVGIDDTGKVCGVEIGKKTTEDLANWMKENTDPPVYADLRVHHIEGKDIVAITISEATEKPVFFKDRAYQRVGKTNQRISSTKIRELAKQEQVRLKWDQLICQEATLDDIEIEKVRWFLDQAKVERNLDFRPDISVPQALSRLELTRGGQLTNAAVLLFGKNPQRFFITAETRCGRFKGTKPLEFIDMKVFAGNLFDQRENAIEFVLRHIELRAKIVGMKRMEKWAYPVEAIREAVTNAIVHKDYQVSANVQVRIFDDRLQVWGCGGLLPPLTLASLKGEHDSILRNPLIGKCFFLVKYIEQWGTGTNRIVDACGEHGLPEPIFSELSGSVVVTLRKEITEDFLRQSGYNERQIRAVAYITEHGSLTNKTYQSLMSVSRATATRDLTQLEEKGIVVRVGKGKRDLRYVFK